MASPTSRTIEALKSEGWITGIVEKWNPHARIRQDLFGFADILAASPDRMPKLIQTTSGSHVSSRVEKIIAEPRARTALLSGFVIEVWGWRRLKVKRGGKAVRWEPRIVSVTLADFAEVEREEETK